MQVRVSSSHLTQLVFVTMLHPVQYLLYTLHPLLPADSSRRLFLHLPCPCQYCQHQTADCLITLFTKHNWIWRNTHVSGSSLNNAWKKHKKAILTIQSYHFLNPGYLENNCTNGESQVYCLVLRHWSTSILKFRNRFFILTRLGVDKVKPKGWFNI